MDVPVRPPRLAWAGLLLALLVMVYVLATGRGPASEVLGCGRDGGCSQVVTSRWAWLGPLSLSLVGVAGYAGTLVTLFLAGRLSGVWRRWALASLFLLSVAGAVFSLWLIGVQHFIIRHYCVYCLTAHGLGILGFASAARFILGLCRRADIRRRLIMIAPLPAALLIALHILLPVNLVRIQAAEPGSPGESYQGSGLRLGEAAKSRKVSLWKGQLELDAYRVPTAGDPQAPVVCIELFDYSCAACRALHEVLKAYQAEHPGSLCLVVYPVPMHPDCNPEVKTHHSGFQYSCELARIAMAAYVADSAAFGGVHDWMLGQNRTVSPKAARAEADRRVGKEKMEAALRDPRVDQLLRDGIALHGFVQADGIPRLILGDQLIAYGGGSSKAVVEALDRARAPKAP